MYAADAEGTVLLKDYPLRLWAQQMLHNDELLREFYLLMESEREGAGSAPAELVAVAEEMNEKFGALIEHLNDERRAALDAGSDRMDLRIPLQAEAVPHLRAIMDVLRRADGYCAHAQLLTLPRPPELVDLADWSLSEFIAQHDGADPTPWPGPF